MTAFALLVNPVAGNGKGKMHYPKIKSELDKRGIDSGVFLTGKAGEERLQFVRAAHQGFKNFIIVGGDGTWSKVINAVLENSEFKNSDLKFGVIPSGTGNDWCRHHQIPFHPLKALEVILKGKTMTHDAGMIRSADATKYFINMAGTGFQGYVVKEITKSGGRKFNRFFYYLKLLQYLFNYKPSIISINCEELNLKEPVFSVAVAVCKYNGGGMMQAPYAVADDGLLDVTVIKKMNLLQLLINLPKISSGSHVRHKKVTVLKTKEILIDSNEILFADTDGELSFQSPFGFSVLPGALKLFVP